MAERFENVDNILLDWAKNKVQGGHMLGSCPLKKKKQIVK